MGWFTCLTIFCIQSNDDWRQAANFSDSLPSITPALTVLIGLCFLRRLLLAHAPRVRTIDGSIKRYPCELKKCVIRLKCSTHKKNQILYETTKLFDKLEIALQYVYRFIQISWMMLRKKAVKLKCSFYIINCLIFIKRIYLHVHGVEKSANYYLSFTFSQYMCRCKAKPSKMRVRHLVYSRPINISEF